MRLVITGATGYIGTWLALRATESGCETHALVRPTSNTTRLPVAVRPWVYDGGSESILRCLSAVRPDVVIHLASAGGSGRSPAPVEEIVSANLLFGTLVLEAMSTTDCRRFINAGSYWEYDSHGRYAPNTLQAATKRAFQDLILYYCRSRGFQALTLTLYDVYGPGDWRCKLIPQLVSALQSGERIRATGGEQGLYFVYIDDVCTGFLHAAREMMAPTPADHRVYALRSDLAVQPKDLVKLLEAVAGRTIDMGWGELPYRDGQIFQPVSSLSRLPGWGAATSLEEGLRRVVAEINAGAA